MATTGADKLRSYNEDYMEDGKRGEEIVINFLKHRPGIEVYDLRDEPRFQADDIDIGIRRKAQPGVIFAEIKTDQHLGVTGNVLFEILRINHTAPHEKACVLGWAARTPATWVFYYSPKLNQIWTCEFSKLRAAFQRYTQEGRKDTRISWVNTDNLKSTVNVLIPESFCAGIFHKYTSDGQPIEQGTNGTAKSIKNTEPDYEAISA